MLRHSKHRIVARFPQRRLRFSLLSRTTCVGGRGVIQRACQHLLARESLGRSCISKGVP